MLAETLFFDNVQYNALLCSHKSKPKARNIGRGVKKMTTDEVLTNLEKNGLVISLKTLQRYRKSEIIPAPKIIGRGRGAGISADWTDETPAHTYAAYCLLNGKVDDEGFKVNPKGIATARQDALEAVKDNSESIEGKNSVNLWVTSIVWLRMVSKFYNDDPKYPEVAFLQKWEAKNVELYLKNWSPEALAKRAAEQEANIKALLASFEKNKNMTPEEKEQQRIKDIEQLREYKEKHIDNN